MSGADHAILDLGEEDLQFTSTDYKAQVRLKWSHKNFLGCPISFTFGSFYLPRQPN